MTAEDALAIVFEATRSAICPCEFCVERRERRPFVSAWPQADARRVGDWGVWDMAGGLAAGRDAAAQTRAMPCFAAVEVQGYETPACSVRVGEKVDGGLSACFGAAGAVCYDERVREAGKCERESREGQEEEEAACEPL